MLHPLRAPFLLLVSIVLAAHAAHAQDYPRPAGLAPLRSKPQATLLTAGLDGRKLEVKFVHGSDVRLRDGHLDGIHPDVRRIDAWLDSIGARKAPVFDVPETELDLLRLRGEQRSGRVLHDLNSFFRIELLEEGSAGRICDALNAFDVVEIAYPLGTVGDPSLPALAIVETPDFEPQQGYRRAAPLGIDADYGNTFSCGTGAGSVLADVETGWTDDHEDIKHKTEDAYVGLAGAPYPWDHGTAVMGELVGEDQGLGVRGIVAGADVRLSSHLGSAANLPTAVVNAINAVGPGDFVLLEVQCMGGAPDPYPCEYVDSIFAAVQTATANGIHVVAVAGNGNRDLDAAAYGGAFDRTVRDSGAILAGASNGTSLDKASFSNYGSRLDAHGWGFDVTTAGYGDLFSDGNPPDLRAYTRAFSGTSSAAPIVLGSAVILNNVYREAFGAALDPLVLRAAITATGTPQGSGGNIGPRPNLRAALAALSVPRIALDGSFTPASSFDVDLFGPANGLYILFSAPQLRANPLGIPPYGYLLLGSPITRLAVGHLDAGGKASYTSTIPGGAIPGDTLAFFQAWQRYGGPGVGAFTNQAELVVQ
jgi:hypothetical protein